MFTSRGSLETAASTETSTGTSTGTLVSEMEGIVSFSVSNALLSYSCVGLTGWVGPFSTTWMSFLENLNLN
jgi:hypothetical protein